MTVKRVILMGPSHYTCMHGMAVSGVDAYETPLGKVRVDQKICQALARQPLFQGPVQAEMPEHSLEMQLPFLQVVLGEFDLVPLVVGELGRHDYAVAAVELRKYVNEETVIVASSDFTHYGPRFGYVPFPDKLKQNLAKLDGDAIKKIIARDPSGFLRYVDETGATICGSRPIGVLLQMLPAGSQRNKAYVLYFWRPSEGLYGLGQLCLHCFYRAVNCKIRRDINTYKEGIRYGPFPAFVLCF